MPSRLTAALALAAALALPTALQAAPLKVVASFSIIGDLARNVGGPHIVLTTLVGPDGDAHVYEPQPADAVAMAAADVVLVNGLHFEGFLQRLVAASATRATIVELTKGVTPIAFAADRVHAGEAEDNAADAAPGNVDPHAFQSIRNAAIYVGNIADAFCAADQADCADYRANARAYSQQLAALDQDVRAAVASIPADKRVVITTHDAFGYFAHEYGLAFLAPQGISTDAEPSAADVATLIRQVRQDKAAALFMENITNPALMEKIAAETGLNVGGVLYSDALSQSDGPASTYIDMMRHNIATIRGAILGS